MARMTAAEMLSGTPDLLYTCSDSEWFELIRYLLRHMAGWLRYEVTTEPLENACVGNGFCVDILHAAPSTDAMVYWKGILGASIIESRIRVSLLVFFYSNGERLIPKCGREYAEYAYIADKPDGGRWELQGWFDDTYGEYERF